MNADDAPLRIYVLDADGLPNCVASCSEDSLGFALRTLREEGSLDGEVGILDRPGDGPGTWLVSPWAASPFGAPAPFRQMAEALAPPDQIGGF